MLNTNSEIAKYLEMQNPSQQNEIPISISLHLIGQQSNQQVETSDVTTDPATLPHIQELRNLL